jgi:hypothetical protein
MPTTTAHADAAEGFDPACAGRIEPGRCAIWKLK